MNDGSNVAVSYVGEDERLLWSGTTNPDVLLAARWPLKQGAVFAPLFFCFLAFMIASEYYGTAAGVVALLLVVAFVAGLRVNNRSRIRKYAESLSYAISDKRVIIAEGDRPAFFVPPEDVIWYSRDDLDGGHADFIFGAVYSESGAMDRRENEDSGDGPRVASQYRDPLAQETAIVGLKSVRDKDAAEAALRKLIAVAKEEAEARVRAYQDALAAGESERESVEVIRNEDPGFSIKVPADWVVEYGSRKKPFGTFAMLVNDWRPDPDGKPWNVIRVQDRKAGTSVELQVHETEPLWDSKKLARHAARATEIDENVSVDGMPGFSFTTAIDSVVRLKFSPGARISAAWQQKEVVLHDGERQYYVVLKWLPAEPADAEFCEAILGTLRRPGRPA